MFLRDYQPIIIKKTKPVKMICSNCSNLSEHFAHEIPKGIVIGSPFTRRPWLSFKNHYLICSICHKGDKKINKDELNALKI